MLGTYVNAAGYGAGVGYPQLPQRPIPPIHHVWVAAPGDGRRLYRSTLFRIPGLLRLGIMWAICVALLSVSAVLDPLHDLTLLAMALCVGYALTDEGHQLFVVGRTASIYDVALDSTGAMFGGFLFAAVSEIL